MTKHVDSKLLNQHVRCMGCEFLPGRAELAPQVVQEVQDQVEYVEDNPSGRMTASEGPESTTNEVHCALGTELCLLEKCWSAIDRRRLSGWRRGQGKEFQSSEGVQPSRPRSQSGDSNGRAPTRAPVLFFCFAVWAISFEGRCLF